MEERPKHDRRLRSSVRSGNSLHLLDGERPEVSTATEDGAAGKELETWSAASYNDAVKKMLLV
jgi:hypothetical protein